MNNNKMAKHKLSSDMKSVEAIRSGSYVTKWWKKCSKIIVFANNVA